MTAAILGKKLGMTSLYTEDGRQIPVTVVEAGPCPVVSKKTRDRDGYSAIQIGFVEEPERKSNKPMNGHFKKAGVKPQKMLKEFRDMDLEVGQELKVDQFKAGDKVRISGTSKGRGFQGVVKRHNFAGVGMRTHGQHNRERAPGSIGQSSYPSRVLKGMKMAGRMGGTRVTIRNIEIVDIIPDQNILLLKGSVPGAPNSFLEIVKQ